MLTPFLDVLTRIAVALEESNKLKVNAQQMFAERHGESSSSAEGVADVAAAVEKQKAKDAAKAKAERDAKAAAKKEAEAKAAAKAEAEDEAITDDAPEVKTRTRKAAMEEATTETSEKNEAEYQKYYDNVLRPAVIKLSSKNRDAAIACLKAEGVTRATELDRSRWQHFVKAVNDAYAELEAAEADDFA